MKYVPPSRLRDLPGELVTREHADVARIHENDPPHVVRGLAKKRLTTQVSSTKDEGEAADVAGQAALPVLRWTPEDGPLPITPYIVDIWRMKILISTAKFLAKYMRMGVKGYMGAELAEHLQPRYIWFPEARASRVEVRNGLPPPDKRRPSWLKGLDLRLDLLDWPQRIRGMLKERGVNAEPILAFLRKRLAHLKEVVWNVQS